jgi:hypothetical protein
VSRSARTPAPMITLPRGAQCHAAGLPCHTSNLVACARKLLVFASSGAVRGPKKAPLKMVATAFPALCVNAAVSATEPGSLANGMLLPMGRRRNGSLSVASECPSISLDSGPAVGRQPSTMRTLTADTRWMAGKRRSQIIHPRHSRPFAVLLEAAAWRPISDLS